MKLRPYPKPAKRWLKVCKHVFNKKERWWEVHGDLETWAADWNQLRVAGCIDTSTPDAHLEVARSERLLDLITRRHDQWLQAAEAACDHALASGRVLESGPDTRCFVGHWGVTVYVAPGNALKTCFRPLEPLRRGASPASQSAQAYRRAVRKAERRASLASNDDLGPGGTP